MILDRRSPTEEWMDDLDASQPAFASALRDLARVNRLTWCYRPTLSWLDTLVKRTDLTHLSILDVAAGGGDMLREVDRWAAKRGVTVELTGLDRSPWAAPYAASVGTPGDYLTTDLFELDPERRFDVVLTSQFTHHLPDPELVRFLRWIEDRARVAWLISDLHRHWIAWCFAWAATRAMRYDPMVVHDSTISVARSFTREDWTRVLDQAGVRATVGWYFPFRWLVSGGPAGRA
jgi:2-polyprenyl-3-methyl-5-hydroxy-6-metoxy-1,4-benzoquinol methylase